MGILRIMPRRRAVKRLNDAWRQLSAALRGRPSGVPVGEMVSGDQWSRARDLDELLADGGNFPRALWQSPPRRIALEPALWRALSHGLDRPDPAKLFDVRDYAPAHHHIARFRDAAVFPQSGLVMPEPGQYWAHSSWPARRGDPKLAKIPGVRNSPDEPTFDVKAWRSAPRMKAPVALVTTAFSFMYGHWLCDSIASVVWLLPSLRDGRVRLLGRPLTDWQRAVLSHLGVPSAAIVECDAPMLRCSDLVVSSLLGAADIGRPSPVQQDNFAALRTAAAEGPRLIYIARDRIVRLRTMVNEDAVIARFMRLGFAILRPERMAFVDQVRAFSGARIVAGAHGSGMANIGLAPTGCVVLEILPELWVQPWTLRLCAVLGHRYVGHIADVEPRSRAVIAHNGSRRFPEGFWFNADVRQLATQARAIADQIGIALN